MTPTELAAHMMPMRAWFDATVFGSSQDRSTSATGGCYLTVDPQSDSEEPSANLNRIAFLGVVESTSFDKIGAIVDLYRDRGIRNFFVETSPCAQHDRVAYWLRRHGFARLKHVRLPTLLRRVGPSQVEPSSKLQIRRLTHREAKQHLPSLRQVFGAGPWGERFMRAAASPHVHAFAAFDGSLLVAAGALFAKGAVGCLGITGTRESHRKQGAQGALIAARLAQAEALELDWCAAETLYRLESSLRNLERAGFRISYDRELWVPSAWG